jgi:nitrous oxidase accessory protein
MHRASTGLLLLAVAWVTRAGAATVLVPPGTGTLQSAVDAAAPGDTLQLDPGTYAGPVVVTKALRIAGPRPDLYRPAP